MSTHSAEHRAKIAESVRRHFDQHPDARKLAAESGRKGGKATNAKRAAAEAEAVELRAAFLAVRLECDRLQAELTATREALARAESALEEARAELARLRGERA